ncbi:MAG: diguanylate cyclase [Woeseiaceae bacterium]
MDYPLCDRCGLDASTIQERLRLLELDHVEMVQQGKALQDQVIAPRVDDIVDDFYSSLAHVEEFNHIVSDPDTFSRLRSQQRDYLLGLGIRFNDREYFEERLRVGAVHQRAGVPQSLYQCTYQALQSLLIENIPDDIREDGRAFETMLRFILKITALDMSLASESYCSAKVSNLTESLASQRDESERLRELAVTDWLTNLHNHSYSRRCLEVALQQAKSDCSPLCVIMADLDNFKNINDKYGHLVGDEVLQIVAARMLSAARTGDEICRYGGEEFLFILQRTNLREGEEIAERVRARINDDEMHSGSRRITLSLSLGLAQAVEDDLVNSLIARADEALYEAKRAGRNCVRIGPMPGAAVH